MPEDIKNKALATVGLGSFSLTKTVTDKAEDLKNTALDIITPQSPQERRADLIERIALTLADIKAAQEAGEKTIEVGVNVETGEIVLSGSPENDKAAVQIKEVTVIQIIEKTQEVISDLMQENEKVKEGPISSVVHATAGAISNIFGPDEVLICELAK